MVEFSRIEIELEDRIALLTVTRPSHLNALDAKAMVELERVFSERLRQEEVGAVIMTGEGEKSFVAGADVKELAELDPLGARERSTLGHQLLATIEDFPRPVIAAINGFCLGGGFELALACHLRIAAEKVRIGLPEVKLGLIPGYGGTQRLPRLVGKGRAMEMILTGETISAEEAASMGLVNRVVPAEELIPVCRKLAEQILANAPLAVQYSMQAINGGLEMPMGEATRLEAVLFGLTCATQDMREGTEAFISKRQPKFKGK